MEEWPDSYNKLTYETSNVNYKKVCTRLAAASDKIYQLLAYGQWFSPGTKTGRYDIAESGIKTPKINQSIRKLQPCEGVWKP